MPLLFSAVFSRALNYDTVLKDLSNSRVFTDFELRCVCCCIRVAVLFSEALDSITNFSSQSTNSKNIFICWPPEESCGSLPGASTMKVVLFSRASDYSTLFKLSAKFFTSSLTASR
jgi:hypothetical protein